MFKVIEYRRGLTKSGATGKLQGKKVVAEFPTLDAARQFAEGKTQTFIEYPRKAIEEMRA